ncbi:MAG: hypothetical protein ABI574_16045 [Burkholderiales bacterium]
MSWSTWLRPNGRAAAPVPHEPELPVLADRVVIMDTRLNSAVDLSGALLLALDEAPAAQAQASLKVLEQRHLAGALRPGGAASRGSQRTLRVAVEPAFVELSFSEPYSSHPLVLVRRRGDRTTTGLSSRQRQRIPAGLQGQRAPARD